MVFRGTLLRTYGREVSFFSHKSQVNYEKDYKCNIYINLGWFVWDKFAHDYGNLN